MTDKERLQRLSERIARAVCSVHGVVTKQEADERERLIAAVGRDWDAINRRWIPVEGT